MRPFRFPRRAGWLLSTALSLSLALSPGQVSAAGPAAAGTAAEATLLPDPLTVARVGSYTGQPLTGAGT